MVAVRFSNCVFSPETVMVGGYGEYGPIEGPLMAFVLAKTVVRLVSNRTTVFANTNAINGPSIGPYSPYPPTITVSGLNTQLLNLTATISAINSDQPHDLEILLVGPGGQDSWLMSNCGGINSI